MVCHRCRAELEERQRFCRTCGADVSSITGADPPTTPPVRPPAPWGPPSPDGGDTVPVVTTAAVVSAAGTSDTAASTDPSDDATTVIDTAPSTDTDTDITTPILYDLAADEPELLRRSPATDRFPVVASDPVAGEPSPADPHPPVESPGRKPTVGVVVVLGVLTGLVTLVAMFPRLLSIRTDSSAPGFPTGDWLVADLGSNLPGALIVALVSLLVGVIGAAFRQRWGYGLVGGSSLAITGWAALTIGLVERPIQVALDAADRPSPTQFTVTITRDLGYGLVLAAGIGGLVTFLATLPRAGGDRRRSLNPWIAALGALAAVIAAAGPLLPEGAASIEDNWLRDGVSSGLPVEFFVGRLVQLGLLAYTGVIGFLLVRRFGLALAIGGATVPVWLGVTTLLELGTDPVGPGYANPGTAPGPIDLHSVTIVGLTALVGLAIVAVISAYDQAAREP